MGRDPRRATALAQAFVQATNAGEVERCASMLAETAAAYGAQGRHEVATFMASFRQRHPGLRYECRDWRAEECDAGARVKFAFTRYCDDEANRASGVEVVTVDAQTQLITSIDVKLDHA